MYKDGPPDEHQKYKELSALSQAGVLRRDERGGTGRPLFVWDSCREICDEYAVISNQGMPSLGAHYADSMASESWDDRAIRQQLLLRIRRDEKLGPRLVDDQVPSLSGGFLSWNAAKHRAAVLAGAAGVIVIGGGGAYHLGSRTHETPNIVSSAAIVLPQELTSASARNAAQGLLDAQTAQISRLQKQVSVDQQELSNLRIASRAADDSFTALSAASNKNQQQLRQVSEQRDKLAVQLRCVEHAYQNGQLELPSLRAEHDRVLLHTTSLESKTEELTAAAKEQERKLRDDEQFLSSDRAIPELMGARKLYIPDFFDINRPRRPRTHSAHASSPQTT